MKMKKHIFTKQKMKKRKKFVLFTVFVFEIIWENEKILGYKPIN